MFDIEEDDDIIPGKPTKRGESKSFYYTSEHKDALCGFGLFFLMASLTVLIVTLLLFTTLISTGGLPAILLFLATIVLIDSIVFGLMGLKGYVLVLPILGLGLGVGGIWAVITSFSVVLTAAAAPEIIIGVIVASAVFMIGSSIVAGIGMRRSGVDLRMTRDFRDRLKDLIDDKQLKITVKQDKSSTAEIGKKVIIALSRKSHDGAQLDGSEYKNYADEIIKIMDLSAEPTDAGEGKYTIEIYQEVFENYIFSSDKPIYTGKREVVNTDEITGNLDGKIESVIEGENKLKNDQNNDSKNDFKND